MNILLDEGIGDVIKNAASKVNDMAFKAYNKYQYLKGAQDSELNFNKKAHESDLPNNINKNEIVNKGRQVKYLDKDELNGFMRLSFNVTDATDEMKRRIDPDNKNDLDSLFQYITDYTNGTVTMTVPMDGYDRRNMKDKIKDTTSAIKDKVGSFMKHENIQINKDDWDYNQEEELTLKMTDESVMTPTPIPYKNEEDNEEELELKESTSYNYRITYYDKDKGDCNDTIVTAESAIEAAKKFKEDNYSEILEIKNDSFTNSKTYYKQGWDNIREEELELELKDPKESKNSLLSKWVDYLRFYLYEVLGWKNDNSVKLRTPMGYEIVLTDTGEGIEFWNETGHDEPYLYYYDTTPEEFRNDMLDAQFDTIEEDIVAESVSTDPLKLALKSYETDHWMGPEEFDNPDVYNRYYSYYDMGPEAFYNEFKDQLDFSPEFIAEYGNSLQEDTTINKDEKVLAVINDVYNKNGDIDSDESLAEIEKQVKQQGISVDANYLGDMIIKSAEMMDTLGEGLTKRDAQTLENKLRAKIKEVFLSPSFGFEEDDWDDYVHVEITSPYVNSEGDKGTKIEVRAELSYEGLMYLAQKLDEILVKYDRDAYFEPVCPGIMDAYIWDNNSVRESLSEGILDPSTCINLDDADSTKNPEEYVEYLIDHELKLDRAKGIFKTVFKPIFFKAIKYLNTFKDIVSNFQQRGNTFYIDYQRPVTEGKKVSFKDHHICQGCGKPLSQCTCEVEGLDFSGGTQVSNIGQHKVDKLDMIEAEE